MSLIYNRLVGKETHIRFERNQGKNGNYKTHIKLVRAEAPQQLPKGILHKLDNIGRFFEGDKPFAKHEKIEYEPKTIKGKVAYYAIGKPIVEGTKFHLKSTAKLLKSSALASESIVIEAGSIGFNSIAHKMRMNSSISDSGKAAMTALTTVSTGKRAVKYLVSYRKKRTHYKGLKQTYKSQKLSSKAARSKLKKARNEISVKKVEKALYKNQKKFQKFAKKQMNKNKVISVPFVPVLVPSIFALKRTGRKGWEETLASDQNNDFLQAANKISRGASATHNAAKPVSGKLHDKRTQARQSKLQNERNRLSEKKTDIKKSKSKHKIKNKKLTQQRAAEKAKAAAKRAAQQAKKMVADFAKFAMKLLGTFIAPIIGIIFIFAVVMMMFTGTSGNSSYILGTYNAQDRYISWACEHYTKIAYDFNEKLLRVQTDDWKKALEEFGVETTSYESKPDKLYWGKSEKFSSTPHFDYDDDKLAAFMCAYYYEPPDNEGNMKYWEWNNESEIDAVLQELFNAEYSFKHSYEDFSGWKQYQEYEVYGGGRAKGGSYYSVYKDNFTKKQMKIRKVPDEIKAFCKDDYLHYDYNTLEVLDANNGDKCTGYFIQDQRYIVTDPKGNQTSPFYVKSMVERSEVEKYIYDGMVHYRTYGTKYALLDDNNKETGYFIENINTRPFEYYKFVWANGTNDNGSTKYIDRAGLLFADDGKQIYYVVPSNDTEKWNSDLKDACLISFYRKNYWYDNCSLYYTVQSDCTFDDAVEKVLKKRENSAERIKFYYLLAQGQDDETPCPYGFHQSMNAPLGTKSLQTLLDNKKIYNKFGYNIKEWNEKDCEGLDNKHNGIDILTDENDKVYAMIDGEVEWVDKDKEALSILGNWNYWYDSNSTRTTALKYVNIKTNLKKGDTVKAGQCIGTVTTKKYCYDNWDSKASKTYLHIEVAIQYENKLIFPDVWADVNPIYLMYRNDNEIIQ